MRVGLLRIEIDGVELTVLDPELTAVTSHTDPFRPVAHATAGGLDEDAIEDLTGVVGHAALRAARAGCGHLIALSSRPYRTVPGWISALRQVETVTRVPIHILTAEQRDRALAAARRAWTDVTPCPWDEGHGLVLEYLAAAGH